jgi:hypothetical protein
MIDIITILTLIINTNPQLIIRWQWRMCIQPVNLHRNKNLYIDGRSMRVVERWRKKFWSRGMDRGRWGLNKQMKAPRTRKWKYFRPFWGPFSGEASPRARGRRGSSSASFLGWEIHAESLARDGFDGRGQRCRLPTEATRRLGEVSCTGGSSSAGTSPPQSWALRRWR